VFHFYGGVGYDFKSCLIFTDPSPPTDGKKRRGPAFTAQAFVQQVIPQLKSEVARFQGSGRVQVILDHATQHDAKISKEALASSGIKVLPDFPAQCWDINIIELVWGKLAEGLRKRRATTARGWKKAIKEEWAKIQQSFINKRVEEVKDRMAEILQKDGAWLVDYKHT
jgi:NADPH:quinone reductase-like Zn-dependent oxidoreductase